MRRILTVIALFALTTLPIAVPFARAADCRFALGFADLQRLIPEIVGDCRENEHFEPATGNALQSTTGGLLVWRKADNWTAFTNGTITWINGPAGLVSRPNAGPLFAWEAPPASSSTGRSSALASAAPPTISLSIDDDTVDSGDPFTVRLEANGDAGLDRIWWWASNTNDDDLHPPRINECGGQTSCEEKWDDRSSSPGRITIHAKARDQRGQESDEAMVTLTIAATGESSMADPGEPTIDLQLDDQRIDYRDRFTVRLEASSPIGIRRMWWWADQTNDKELREMHTIECGGAKFCKNNWDDRSGKPGRIVIHAQSEDTNGERSDIADLYLRIRNDEHESPEVKVSIDDNKVDNGETFEIRVRAETSGVGIEKIWWYASSTDDDDLREDHVTYCGSSNYCEDRWKDRTTHAGDITIHAKARTEEGEESEVTTDLFVREANP